MSKSKPKLGMSTFDSGSIIKETEDHVANQEGVKEDLHKYVVRGKWPMTDDLIAPSLPKGGDFSINMIINMKQYLRNAIDRHVKALGVSKAEWMRHAAMKLMQEEQLLSFKKNKEKP